MDPAPPAALRSKGEATRTLILAEISTGRHTALRSLAQQLDVTVQAVSDHLRRLTEEGLAAPRDQGLPAPTPEGIAWLHGRLRELRDFVSACYRTLTVIDSTPAEAGAAMQRGAPVGLFMERGRLVAYPKRDSPSTGRALADAARGEDVPVGELAGLVDLAPATLTVLLLPGSLAGGSRRVDPRALKKRLESDGDALLAVQGPVARAALRKTRRAAQIEHAPVEASAEACLKGQPVLLLASEDEEQDLHDALASAARRLGRFPSRIERL